LPGLQSPVWALPNAATLMMPAFAGPVEGESASPFVVLPKE
jgi:hypothetical protein